MVGTMAKIDDSVKKKVPELRFPGFTDDWEERKLSEGTSKIGDGLHGTPNYSDNGDVFFINGNNLVNGKIVITKETKLVTESNQSKDDKLLNMDTILMSINGTIGNLAWYNNERVMLGKSAAYLTVSNFDKKFIFSYLQTSTIKNYFLNNLTGTTIKNLGLKTIRDTTLFVPTLEEQQKIGSFFKQLDDTIALHQRKLDLLKEQKKGYLQKMFPKNGAKVPELRFAGFADDWEQRKLSDVANHRGGTAIEKYFDKDGVYKVISIGSYGLNSQYVDQNIRAISNEITDGRVVNSGELTMVLNDKTANGTIIGRTLLVEKDNEYVINQRTEIISPKENFDSSFAYTILNGPFREKVKRIVQGGTQIYVNYPAVSNLNLELPEIEEQQKIGSFFKQLDDTIALHQRKLDLLKEQKKGFLQKMFV
ncbi:restriction endonuclease subunit S [Lactococcus cremoris]|uniref:restriction endonuclease subunit S n=1 Tax=Lactococcus lactis subsp. cremoris TaxID=1359 RepID=UPI0009BF6EBD|nr:restriction endonuclease subunit S [Lactococcus cremoris]